MIADFDVARKCARRCLQMDNNEVLFSQEAKWEPFWKALDIFTDDFMEDGRGEELTQRREEL